LTENGSNNATLPTPPWSFSNYYRVAECRAKCAARKLVFWEIFGLIDEHLAYEVWSHYENYVAAQHPRSEQALSINCAWPGFDRIVYYGSEQPKQR
jgi:hypothetical protein